MTRKHIRRCCAALSLALAVPALAQAPRVLDLRLFSIYRSTNSNEVVYEAVEVGDGFDMQHPIRVYWVLHARGDRIEALTHFEEAHAYGVVVQHATHDEIAFQLRAVPSRPITVRREGAAARAYASIAGEECALSGIYVAVHEGFLIPSVSYVVLSGTSRSTGKPLSERVQP
jgi:hypothetical protein